MNRSSARVAELFLVPLAAMGMSIFAAQHGVGSAQAAAQNATAGAESLRARALRIHREAIVFDGHMDSVRSIMRPGWRFTDRHDPSEIDDNLRAAEGHLDLPRMQEGGLTGGFFAVSENRTDPAIVEGALRQLDALRSVAEALPEKVMLCLTANDVRRAKAAGKVAMVLAVEGGRLINDNLAVLRTYARLGVRYMTLTHRGHTSWADSSGRPPQHNGLTDFGEAVVREMNRLGVIVDVSHTSDKTFYDALETTQAPAFASHSAARALSNHSRNLTDDMIKALAAKGGVMAINFHAGYLDLALTEARQKLRTEVAVLRKELEATYPGEENAKRRADEVRALRSSRLPRVPWTLIVDHIDHAVKLVGVDHIALGSDFDGAPMPDGLADVSYLPRITEELLRRGYREADIKKILGGNTLRLLEQVEAISKKLRAQATNGTSARP